MSPLYWFILAYMVVGVIVSAWVLHKDKKEQRVDLQGTLLDIQRRTDRSIASSSADTIGTALGYLVGTLLWPITVVNLRKEKVQRQATKVSASAEGRVVRTPDRDDGD